MSAKIAARYRRDRSMIARALGFDPGPAAVIRTGLGDRHRGGQTVARVVTESGSGLAFKPRSVEPERLWATVVMAVEEQLGLGLIVPKVAARKRSGWVQWIEPDGRPMDTPEDGRRWGGVLALLDLLEVRDAHPHNFVRARGQPVLIDAETIAHPRLPGFESLPSIILSGALPWPPGSRRPALLGTSEIPLRSVEQGYRDVHRHIGSVARAWLRPTGILGRFRALRVRIVLRPTRVYASALRRRRQVLPPPPGVSDPAVARRIMHAERRALARGDIPLFEADIDGTHLRDEGRVIARDFFARSGWGSIAERWKHLGPGDAHASVRLVRSTLRLDQAVRPGSR